MTDQDTPKGTRMPRTIQPTSPTNGLFAVAREVPWTDSDIDWTPNGGWATNVICPSGGVLCCDSTEKEDPNDPDPQRFKPFMMHQVAGCSEGTSRTQGARQDARDHVNTWLDINTEGWVTAALEEGVCDNPGLQDAIDVTATSGAAASIHVALGILLRNRAQAGIFDRPIIHVPLWFAPVLGDNLAALSLAADIAFGPGYGFSTDAPAGEAWVYVTGPVEYSVMPTDYLPDATIAEMRQNTNYEINERIAIVRYDTCSAAKIRVKSC